MARVAPSERFRRELDEVLAGVDGEPPALAAGARFARVLAGAEQDQAFELGRSAPPTMPRVASCPAPLEDECPDRTGTRAVGTRRDRARSLRRLSPRPRRVGASGA